MKKLLACVLLLVWFLGSSNLISKIFKSVDLPKAQETISNYGYWILYYILPEKPIRTKVSWYGPGFHGQRTACGQIYNQNHLTAAHTALPCGTRVRFTDPNTGVSRILTINDRGPFTSESAEKYRITGNSKVLEAHHDREYDLSRKAGEDLGVIKHGTKILEVKILN